MLTRLLLLFYERGADFGPVEVVEPLVEEYSTSKSYLQVERLIQLSYNIV